MIKIFKILIKEVDLKFNNIIYNKLNKLNNKNNICSNKSFIWNNNNQFFF